MQVSAVNSSPETVFEISIPYSTSATVTPVGRTNLAATTEYPPVISSPVSVVGTKSGSVAPVNAKGAVVTVASVISS